MNKQEKAELLELEEMKDIEQDKADDNLADQIEDSEAYRNALSKEGGENYNQHDFLRDTMFSLQNPMKATYLSESEKGRPLFSVIFLADMVDVAKHYIDPLAKELGVDNKVANYFQHKIENVCDAGLSNKGFIQMMNSTKRILSERQRNKPGPMPEHLKKQ